MEKQNSWHSDFEKIDDLGKGDNANVYYVKEKNTNQKFALKELYKKSPEKRTRFANEIDAMKNNAPIIKDIIPILRFKSQFAIY